MSHETPREAAKRFASRPRGHEDDEAFFTREIAKRDIALLDEFRRRHMFGYESWDTVYYQMQAELRADAGEGG